MTSAPQAPVPAAAQPRAPARIALRGDLLDYTGEPGLDDPLDPSVRFRPDHWLLVEDGRIAGALPAAVATPGPDWALHDHRARLVMPGFIDTHVHSAQVDVIGSWGTELLDWLQTHTFPAEARMADPAHARVLAELFLDALLAHGTTTACVYPTLHEGAVDALFDAALSRGMRLIAGKVLMDRHAPDSLRDADAASAAAVDAALIARWHGRGRLACAVTPRFAATSSPAQLQAAGEQLARVPGLYMQTHVAENTAEVRWIAELFPEARSYLDVYDRFGLLGPRSILAHGIWLDDQDRRRLADSGAQIAFCPSSNLFLGSGLFDWAGARAAGVAVSLASDVGGGTHLSMRRTLLAGYQVQALRQQRVTAHALLHAATRGAARALHLDGEIGSLEVGATADLCVWDWASDPLSRRRQAVARDLHEKLFAWITSGAESDLVETWIAAEPRYGRAG